MLFSRDLHVFMLPKAVDTLVVHLPITRDQKPMNTLRSEARTLPSQRAHLAEQLGFIMRTPRLVTLRTAWLTEYPAGATL